MKKFLLLVAFTISCFFIYTLNTNASTSVLSADMYVDNISVKFNGENFTTNGFKTVPGGVGVELVNNATLFLGYTTLQPSYIYARYTLCVDNNISAGWGNSNANDVYFMRTAISCNYYGSTHTGAVTFGTFKINTGTALSGTESIPLDNSVGFANWVDTSFGLLGIEYSITPFPVYTPYETLIKQNDSILNALEQFNVGNGNIGVKIDEANSKLNSLNDTQKETNKKLEDVNNTLNNKDSSEAQSEAESFFSGFETDTFGLTSIITAPLNLIGSITSSTCSPLGLEVPFVDSTLNLPCMTSIYQRYFGNFLTIYQTITFGIIAYWVCVRIFALVKDFKNPDHDEIEVMDL